MVSARAACPVLVLHRAHRIAPGAPVVVGVSSARSSAPAVDAAFAEASWRHCDLVAVHAWTQPDPVLWDQASQSGVTGAVTYPDLLDATRRRAVITLSEALAGPSGRFPEVVVRHVLHAADPVEAMTRAAEDACVMVVGRHRRGTRGTIGLGPVMTGLTPGWRGR